MRPIAVWFWAITALWVPLEGLFSYREGMFFPSQVKAKWGEVGIAFITHGGMWWNMIALPLVGAYIIDQYIDLWTPEQIRLALGIGFVVALANHLRLMFGQTIPDPLGWKKQWWSMTIFLHFIYMTVFVAIGVLYFFFSGKTSFWEAVAIAILFALDTTLGMHVLAGVLNLWGKWPLIPKTFLRTDVMFFQMVVWFVLSYGAVRVADSPAAGTAVVLTFAGLLGITSLAIAIAPR